VIDGVPAAAVAVPASGAAAETGTFSGPGAPGPGADSRVPSVLSAASLSPGVTPLVAAEPPAVMARMMAAAITTAAAPVLRAQIRRRRRRASSARSRAILSLGASLFLLPLGIGPRPFSSLVGPGTQARAAEPAAAEPG
jgi:hypothetical protein